MAAPSLRTAADWVRSHTRLAHLALALAVVPLFVVAHHFDPSVPHAGAPGWWAWIDQGRYIEAVRAWAALSLDPARHWYFPGYPLLGAPFVGVMPDDPFYVANLACLVASAWLFAALGERLAPTLPGARIIAGLVFLAELHLSRLMLRSFVEPWTTTPTIPLAFGCLLLCFRFQDRPGPRTAVLLGLVATAGALFRPADALVLTAVAGCFAAACLVAAWPGSRRAAAIAASGVLGAAAPLLLALALHLAVHGWNAGGYLSESQTVGFEWRLLPLRWVIVAASAVPLLDGEKSLSQAFFWFIPGLAGMASCLAVVHGRALARHLLTITAALSHLALYLAYRDLQPQGVIRFGNYHYVRWELLLLGLYSVLLVLLVWRSRRALRAWGLGMAVVFALFSWRADWTPATGYAAAPVVLSPHRLVLDGGLHSLFDGIRVGAGGDFAAIYLGPHTMTVDQRIWRASVDFKAWPVPGGFILTLQRPLLDETLTLSMAPPVTLDADRPAALVHAGISMAPPWWMGQVLEQPQR
jgi:hypothetical protein